MIIQNESMSEIPVVTTRPCRIHWGALIAGLFVIAATGWVLSLLGSALGLSVADASDAQRISKGFGIALTIWMAFSWWFAFVAGSFVTTQISNTYRRDIADFQSVTLWAVSCTVTLFFAFLGVGGLAAGATKAMTVGATAIAPVGVKANPGTLPNAPLFPSELINGTMAALKREATRVASEASNSAEINAERIRTAMGALESDSVASIALEIVMDRPGSAKDLLVARTNLTDREADAIVSGARRAIEPSLAEAKAKLEKAKEDALNYAQAGLWTLFAGAAIALFASFLGGRAGLHIDTEPTVAAVRTPTAVLAH